MYTYTYMKRESELLPLNCVLISCCLYLLLFQLRAKVDYVQRGGDPRLLEGCLNVVLTGNPGAGKTTAARLLARWLRAHGLLQQDTFVERNALELKVIWREMSIYTSIYMQFFILYICSTAARAMATRAWVVATRHVCRTESAVT